MTSQQSNAGNSPAAPQLSAQIALEEWCVGTGGQRATAGDWMKGADGFMSHSFAAPYLEQVLKLYRKAKSAPTNFGAMWGLMEDEKAVLQVAAESLVHVISHSMDGRKRNSIAVEVGKRAEFVLWLNHPMWKGSLHLRGLRLANGRTLDMSLMRKRLIDKGFKKAALYQPLSKEERLKLGTMFVEVVAQTTGLMTFDVEDTGRGRKALVCRMTKTYWNFMRNWQRNLLLFRPVYMPMVVPPGDWTAHDDGGFVTLGTTCSTVPWERWPDQMKSAHECVLGSLNYLQSVPFQFNHEQVELQRQVWDLGHPIGALPCRERMEQPNNRKCMAEGMEPTAYWNLYWRWKGDQRANTQRTHFINSMVGYRKLKDAERFYWVWFNDSRGRKYQRGSQLNYLGNDVSRSQIVFDRPAPMRGHEPELMWALGDAWGLPKDQKDRDVWASEHFTEVMRTGVEPLDCIGWWEQAKEPWRFVALCRELSRYMADDDYQTRMVFQLDQTCSGYGHLACLLRDVDLALLTNVVGEVPADLYEAIRQVVQYQTMPWHSEDERTKKCADWWAEWGFDRKLIKLCVMPCIYGRSHQSMLRIIEEHCRDRINNFLTPDGIRVVDLAKTLGFAINAAVKVVLPSVNGLQKWLRVLAKASVDQGKAPSWVTPNGMRVLSYGMETNEHNMYLELSGRMMKISCGLDDGVICKQKSYSRLAADYIHSMDAAFLERFIWHWRSYEYPLVTVHDCVGTSLDKVALLRRELNDQFARFYSEDHLSNLKQRVEDETGERMPWAPYKNTLELQDIGENLHLFC